MVHKKKLITGPQIDKANLQETHNQLILHWNIR